VYLRDVLQDKPNMCVEIGPLIFVWHGGQYVDILMRHGDMTVFYTDMCVNVYSYPEATPRIPFGDDHYPEFIDAMNQWLKEQV
jgi:hypothetical protein